MVDLADASVVAILTRAPSAPGKSRLFAAIGCPPDPSLTTALLLDTLDAATIPGTRRVIAVEPAAACDEVRALAPGVEVMPQADGTLGDRMAAAMGRLLGRGARAVALVGSDLPDLPPQAIASAFARLQQDPAALVLGPAHDGGYYLIAATCVPPVFAGVEWGGRRVLDQTLELARQAGIAVHLLDSATDVDDISTLAAVQARRTSAWWRTHSGSTRRPAI